MATDKQIAANRRNAKKNTGPKTEDGKLRSRQNAVRHGLTAETVITGFEDVDEYSAFEASIIADYDPQTAIERSLAARLASLLWRLRRATAIESGLLQIQTERDHNRSEHDNRCSETSSLDPLIVFRKLLPQPGKDDHPLAPQLAHSDEDSAPQNPVFAAAQCFVRLHEMNCQLLDRITRYELALWRQVAQTLLILGNTYHARPRFWSLPRSRVSRESRS